MNSQQRLDTMTERLTAALSPEHLNISDDSAAHHGHAGAQTGKGHFTVEIKSPQLSGLSRIAQHRAIHQALGDMMQDEIHALRIRVIAD